MPSHQPVDVDYVTDLVHRQGGELLRVRGELEESQKMRDILINASRSMGKQLNNLYKTSIQWHLRLESMTQEFAALKTGSEAFLAELDAARTGFDTELRSVHPSENVSDEISSVSDFSVSSLGTANVEKDDNYEKVVPPSPGLNLNPAESSTKPKNVPATQEASVTATPMRVASVREELENYAAREDRSDSSLLAENSEAPKECGANAIASGTIPVSNGTHEVSSTATQFSLNTGASSSLNPRINETYEHFSIAGMNPVCTKLPKSKAVKTMCQTVIGNPAQTPTHILKHPEALFVLPNSWHHTLVTVSREANDLCTALKKVNPNWRGHLLVQSSATGCLFYLGQYQGGASQKITADEYHSLPEETKNYVLNCAKTVRPREISTQGQLLLSLGEADGIHVAKTELRFVGYSTTIEANLRAEARQKGYVTDI